MENDYFKTLWDKAIKSYNSAKDNATRYPDTAANRAYYCAFYAVSALFASEGVHFKKHSAIRAAVHKDLIHTKRWESELGDDFDNLIELRELADYGGADSVSKKSVKTALDRAKRILKAIHMEKPELFLLPKDLEHI